MPRLLPARRGASALRLRVRPADEPPREDDDLPADPTLPWHLSALLAGVGGAFGGWLIVAALVVMVWLAARVGSLTDAIGVGTQAWLLSNGAGLELGGQRLTLVPLGATLLFALLVSGLVQTATRAAVRADVSRGGRLEGRDRGRIVRNVALVAAGAYAVSVTLAASLVGSANQGARALVGSLLIGAVAAVTGASRGADHRLRDMLPDWAAPIPGALVAGVATALAGGAAALATGLWVRRDQVHALYAALAPDAASTVSLTLLQLLYVPTMVIWASAYATGAGFTLGEGSVVSPAATDLGMVPGIPVLGALPVEGAGSNAVLAWLAVAVVAGVVAAVVVARGRRAARVDETALVGALAGVGSAAVLVGLATVSRGDLGTARLVGMGPRLTELALLGGSLMGLSGAVTGCVVGLVRRPARVPAVVSAEDHASEDREFDDEYADEGFGDELADDGFDHELAEDGFGGDGELDEPTNRVDLGEPAPGDDRDEPTNPVDLDEAAHGDDLDEPTNRVGLDEPGPGDDLEEPTNRVDLGEPAQGDGRDESGDVGEPTRPLDEPRPARRRWWRR